ncbi:glycerophosphodiester phosphodiesterase [Thiohalorhabdus sp. Cl-TMA]|uniref:Glycerophosphodiester phosphodiesterase n=1 Tax=Thiohalorhabdus methylotrophus TaxID=3242694 RepID=A0ABV4TTU7_9GAMM
MLVIGHRGVREPGCTENTLEAFQRAAEQGVDGIETDVRLTRDGRLVLFHDRLSAAGVPVAETDHGHLEAMQGHHVPELAEALGLWPDLLWDLEIKDAAVFPALRRVLPGLGGRRPLLTSFRHDLLHAYDGTLGGCPVGLVIGHRPLSVASLLYGWRESPRPGCFIWNGEYLDGTLLEEARTAGMDNFLYNLQTQADVELARARRCAGVILDRPGAVREAGPEGGSP